VEKAVLKGEQANAEQVLGQWITKAKANAKIEQEAKAKALEYYEKKIQKKGTSTRVTDFGCYIQIEIIEGNEIVVSLTYKGREIQEI
jgi:hypothetical protein